MAATAKRGNAKSAAPILAGGVLLIVGGLLVAVLYLGGLKNKVKEKRAEEQAVVLDGGSGEPAATTSSDPFAPTPGAKEVEAERIFGTRQSAESEAVDPFSSMDDPFSPTFDKPASTLVPGAGELTGSKLWQNTMKAAGVVGGRLMLAAEAREKGEPAEEKDYRREAIAALDAALVATDKWVEQVVDSFDPEDLQVRTVYRTRKKWKEQAAELRALDAL